MAVKTAVIGIDCATTARKVGLAFGEVEGFDLRIHEATVCSKERSAVATICQWAAHSDGPLLLAIDAPLGWPARLGRALPSHSAGAFIDDEGNALFRRATDRFVAERIGITPLDVGADRIARTALSALRLIHDLRERLQAPIPLAWSSALSSAQAQLIEVYPAATLRTRGYPHRGYKPSEHSSERRKLIDRLGSVAQLPTAVAEMESNADALDAAFCLLAASDFLTGAAMSPPDEATRDLAEREGWIWVRGRE